MTTNLTKLFQAVAQEKEFWSPRHQEIFSPHRRTARKAPRMTASAPVPTMPTKTRATTTAGLMGDVEPPFFFKTGPQIHPSQFSTGCQTETSRKNVRLPRKHFQFASLPTPSLLPHPPNRPHRTATPPTPHRDAAHHSDSPLPARHRTSAIIRAICHP